MHRSDDVVEFAQRFVVKIERAVAQDVALDSGEKPERVEGLVELANGRDLDAEPGPIEPAGLDGTAAVIGDAEILQTSSCAAAAISSSELWPSLALVWQ